MAPRIIYSYNPSVHIVKATNIPDTTISVVANNVAFRSSFPNQIDSEELQDFANFLASCRLRYALVDVPMFFYPKQICEFWYTCTYNSATNLITGTVADGSRRVSISVDKLRTALRLPTFEAYSDLPNDAKCRSLLPQLGYDETQGNMPRLILRQCFPAAWKYLTGVIGKCLGHKTSSLDQLNSYELKILYCLVFNKRTNYAQLFFDQLMDMISATRRSNYVPFPRWIALILENFNQGYNINSGPEHQFSLLSPRIIQGVPQPDDVYMTEKMLDWINNPYTADLPEYHPENDAIHDPNQQHQDQEMENASSSDQEMENAPSSDEEMADTSANSYHSSHTEMVRVSASSSSPSAHQ